MTSITQPTIYRKNRGVQYAHVVEWTPAQVKADVVQEFGPEAWTQLQALCDGAVIHTRFARYSLDPQALEATDPTPLWRKIADPGYYNGTDARGTQVRGR